MVTVRGAAWVMVFPEKTVVVERVKVSAGSGAVSPKTRRRKVDVSWPARKVTSRGFGLSVTSAPEVVTWVRVKEMMEIAPNSAPVRVMV